MTWRLTTHPLFAVVLACAALCQSTVARAHDFWIEPAAFRPATGTSLPVTLRVGENFSGTSQPFVPQWFVDFSVSSSASREPVRGFVGDDPAATLPMKTPGLRLVGYHSTRDFVDLEAARFDQYLQAEGLESIRALRRQRGEEKTSGREYYSRCAKSLVSAGDGPGKGFDAVLGYPLELILRANPYALAPGALLPLLLNFRGKPLPGVLVVAFTADQPTRRFQARTGSDGTVTLPLDRGGRWLVKAVHMIEVPDSDLAADWESFWASVTFEVAGNAAASK